MTKSTIISLVMVSAFTLSAASSVRPRTPATQKFVGHRHNVARDVIISSAIARSIRQAASRNSGGGSSYGK